MFKKLVASILILPFLIVPLFCCCIKTAQAATTTTAEKCHDSGDTGSADHHEHSNSDHSHASCDCHSFSTAAENGTSLQVVVPNFDNSFASLENVEPRLAAISKGSMRMAYLGPPGGPSAVPLYTLYHSLRI